MCYCSASLPNPCRNSPCGDLCLITPQNASVCACRNGFNLSGNACGGSSARIGRLQFVSKFYRNDSVFQIVTFLSDECVTNILMCYTAFYWWNFINPALSLKFCLCSPFVLKFCNLEQRTSLPLCLCKHYNTYRPLT